MSTNKYQSDVSKEYKELTKNDLIRYKIEENVERNKNIVEEELKNRNINNKDFSQIYLNGYQPNMFDIRKLEIREDSGQRNCLTDKLRRRSAKNILRNFDSRQFDPIKIHKVIENGKENFILTDGGMRAHCAFLLGIYKVPALIYEASSVDEIRSLYYHQDDNNTKLSDYDKYRHNLLLGKKPEKELFDFAKKAGVRLASQETHIVGPVVPIGITKRCKRSCKEDSVILAINYLRDNFPHIDEIQGGLLEGLSTFFDISPKENLKEEVLDKFFKKLIKENESLKDHTKWIKELKFDSSNKYGSIGAGRFCQKWNDIMSNHNKGRQKNKISFFKDSDINICLNNPEYLDSIRK